MGLQDNLRFSTFFDSPPEASVIRSSQIALRPTRVPKAQAWGEVLGLVLAGSCGLKGAVASVDCGGSDWGGEVGELRTEGGRGDCARFPRWRRLLSDKKARQVRLKREET